MQPTQSTQAKSWLENLRFQIESFDTDQFKADLRKLFKFRLNPVAITKTILFSIGTLLTFITLSGALIGYCISYLKFLRDKDELPRLHNLPKIVVASMVIGAILVWGIIIVLINVIHKFFAEYFMNGWQVYLYLAINLALSMTVYAMFRRWRVSIWNLIHEQDKHGTARYAEDEDLLDYTGKPGLYIGGGLTFSDKGHILLCAGTRGGKGTNILMYNVFNPYGFESSKVILDVKGEMAAVWAKHLIKMGKRVVIINPWELLGSKIPPSSTYNPLQMLSHKDSPHLIDDVAVVSEMICPASSDDKNKFFSDSARNLIAGLLLHLVTTDKVTDPTLTTLWQWCRLYGRDWDELLADMNDSTDPINGLAIRNAANEILKQSESPETFSSIMSHVLETTSFLKSRALQDSIVSGFNPYDLTDGNTVVFIVFPIDKVQSHSSWMRLIISTMMRSVVRRPSDKKVVFVMDEAASTLGYSREWETALSAYAGFNLTMLIVYQDLSQVADTFGKRWESVVANCTIRQFMSIKDNFSAEYISKMAGETTRIRFSSNWMGKIHQKETTQRLLMTPNEVTRTSQNNIIIFTGENPVAVFPKAPYYLNPIFKDANGANIYEPNPYIENGL